MAVIDAVCKDKNMALLILEAIAENINSETQKKALGAVSSWIQENKFEDISKLTHEQREDLMAELLASERNMMTDEERKERAAFYLEDIKTGRALRLLLPMMISGLSFLPYSFLLTFRRFTAIL